MLGVAHLVVFGFACLGSFIALWRTRLISHAQTRYGLYGLFVTSGLWAGTYLVTFLTSSLALATAAYQIGLVCGLATVGAWLYFCSAYTGHTYHQESLYRRLALLTFLAICTVKLTNQLHGLYFSIEMVKIPFPHASVTLLGFHWAVTILAYALAAVGFYMLFQLFIESHIPTTNLTILVALMALPALFNALGMLAVPGLVAANYEPVGVAAFALGTLYVAEDTFEQVRWTGHQQVLDEINEAIVLLDDDGRIYEFNAAAERLVPEIAVGDTLDIVVPDAPPSDADSVPSEWVEDASMVTIERQGETRYYLLRETSLTIGPHQIGRAVVLSDVTQVERQRRELERQSTQLEGFAAAVAHELRNGLSIIDGNLILVAEALDKPETHTLADLVNRMSDATDRMSDVVADLTTIAQLSQPVTDPQWLSFQTVVSHAFGTIATEGVSLTVEGEGRLRAEKTRLTELIRNAARLADATDATELLVRLAEESLVVETNGASIAQSDTDALFNYGSAVPHADAGMLGPNIKSLAQAHGWEVAAETPEADGIIITISGVTIE